MSKEINFDNLIIFDLETTGLDHNKNEILEIGAIDATTKDTFQAKIQFDMRKADLKALEMNSYNEEEWRHAVPLQVALTDFSIFCKSHSHLRRISAKGLNYQVCALGGYNVCGFDKFFISKAFEKTGQFMPADYRMFDVMQLCFWMFPGLETYKLQEMCNYFNLKNNEEFHGALADAKMTLKLLRKIIRLQPALKKPEWV